MVRGKISISGAGSNNSEEAWAWSTDRVSGIQKRVPINGQISAIPLADPSNADTPQLRISNNNTTYSPNDVVGWDNRTSILGPDDEDYGPVAAARDDSWIAVKVEKFDDSFNTNLQVSLRDSNGSQLDIAEADSYKNDLARGLAWDYDNENLWFITASDVDEEYETHRFTVTNGDTLTFQESSFINRVGFNFPIRGATYANGTFYVYGAGKSSYNTLDGGSQVDISSDDSQIVYNNSYDEWWELNDTTTALIPNALSDSQVGPSRSLQIKDNLVRSVDSSNNYYYTVEGGSASGETNGIYRYDIQ